MKIIQVYGSGCNNCAVTAERFTQLARELGQEVFLKVMSNSQKFCSLTDGKAWLFKVTKNHFIGRLRKKLNWRILATITPLILHCLL
ncbi:RNA polymerase sigma factor RpoE [Vibrio thalassae]|uniref:RNA polymerase sigma factor RpoE n=1 Tax=Vibrio thalassae TaxID=1243014 RepID=A0A240EM68_9VIBR|nr:RNA polymerase sigma factor RpoE [Vibrio thalassae]